MCARVELANASQTAPADDRADRTAGDCCLHCRHHQKSLSRLHQQMLDDRAQSDSAGKKVSAPTIRMTPTSRPTKSGVVTGKVPAVRGDCLLLGQEAGQRQHRDDHREAAEQHREPEHRVVEEVVAGEPGERAAVVAGGRGEGVEDLGQPVRSGVVQPREPGRQHRPRAR